MSPFYDNDGVTLYHGSAEALPLADGIVQTCVTSPPYWGLRDYGIDGQIGLEPTPEQYVARMVGVFREVRRVLKDDGTCWLNLGDSYAGSWGARGRSEGTNAARPDLEVKHGTAAPNRYGFPTLGVKPKDLVGIPWRVAFALQADGWYLRSDIIWHKPNPMPESVTDRPTKAHEFIFLFSKSERYYYDAKAIAETSVIGAGAVRNITPRNKGQDVNRNDGDRFGVVNDGTRNRRSVWTVTPAQFPGAHFATFPPDLITPCILAGSRPGDIVLDCFNGSGTTGKVARDHGRRYVGVELNAAYLDMTCERFRQGYIFPVGALEESA